MKKQFHGLLLGISVLPALLVMPAVAETYVATIYHSPTGSENASRFESFDAALADSEDWSKGKGIVVESGSNITYDFGGKTYTGYTDPAGSSKTRNQVFQLLKYSDITLKNGTINIAADATNGFWMGIQNYADLTLDNMTIDGTNLQVPGSYALSNNQGTVNIKNSTIIAKDGEVAFDLWYWVPRYPDGVYVNLENSTVSGKIEIGAPGAAIPENVLTHAVLNIKGNSTISGNIENNNGTINLTNENNTIVGTIDNNGGIINVNDGATLINGVVLGNGTLTVANGATLNIGTALIEQGTIHLNGTMVATLNTTDDYRITAGTFDGTGTLSLALASEGTYKLFGNATFANLAYDGDIKLDSPIYNIDLVDNGKSISVTRKTVAEIAQDNDISSDSAQMVANLSDSSSEKLNYLAVLVQEQLALGNTDAVESVNDAINPETTTMVQSVTTSVQNTVTNIAASRMSLPTIGRAGGDVNVTARGVYAQGLYNKSKMNGNFDGNTWGGAAGYDVTLNRSLTLGLGYSFSQSDVDAKSRDIDIDSNTVFLYGQYKPSEWYINSTLNYTMSKYQESGNVLGMAVDSDYDVNAFGATVMTGYDFASGVTPEFGLRYLHITTDDYVNSLGINNKMDDTNFLTAVLGAKYAFDVRATDTVVFRPELRYAFKYDVMSDKLAATVAMPGVNSYTLNAERLSRIGNEFGIGLGVVYDGLNISLNYDIDIREDYTSQTGMVRARYNF